MKFSNQLKIKPTNASTKLIYFQFDLSFTKTQDTTENHTGTHVRSQTHASRFAIPGSSIYLSLAHERTTLENDILQKVPPVNGKPKRLQFWLN